MPQSTVIPVLAVFAVCTALLAGLLVFAFREARRIYTLDRRLSVPRRQALATGLWPQRRKRRSRGLRGETRELVLALVKAASILAPVGAAEREKLAGTLRLAGFGHRDALSLFLSVKLGAALAGGTAAGLWATGDDLLGEHAFFVALGRPGRTRHRQPRHGIRAEGTGHAAHPQHVVRTARRARSDRDVPGVRPHVRAGAGHRGGGAQAHRAEPRRRAADDGGGAPPRLRPSRGAAGVPSPHRDRRAARPRDDPHPERALRHPAHPFDEEHRGQRADAAGPADRDARGTPPGAAHPADAPPGSAGNDGPGRGSRPSLHRSGARLAGRGRSATTASIPDRGPIAPSAQWRPARPCHARGLVGGPGRGVRYSRTRHPRRRSPSSRSPSR